MVEVTHLHDKLYKQDMQEINSEVVPAKEVTDEEIAKEIDGKDSELNSVLNYDEERDSDSITAAIHDDAAASIH